MILLPLTANEKKVLEYIESYFRKHEIAPSYQEIKDHFGFASYNSVQRYLKQLQTKKYIHIPGGNQKRAITLLRSSQAALQNLIEPSTKPFIVPPPTPSLLPSTQKGSPAVSSPPPPETFSLPLLGRVAAGQPLEAYEYDEFVQVSGHLLRDPARSYALRVSGNSMIEDGILDQDLILVQEQSHAKNGDIVVATVDNEATVKRFYLHKSQIELRPANSEMRSFWYEPEQVSVRGLVVGLVRKY